MKEQDIENSFIEKLKELKYNYRSDIKDISTLTENFRNKFNELNQVNLTDSEFSKLLERIITPDIFKASNILRSNNSFERDDGTPLYYTLVNIKDWCKNTFEVIKQPRFNTDNSFHRYDVILLINGIPIVQVELKSLDITPRKAIKQIIDYKNDVGNGYGKTLMCFIQLFIVSNQTITWYFANNNTRHFSFDADEKYLPFYEFADEKNNKITNIYNFADKFLAKCTLGQMISRYIVLVKNEQKLIVMRPYQVYAVKAIVDCIEQNCGNGYIWHTTGSGKTLTSFKASTLLKDNENIYKCLFVVDRKDLDKQTREEFNRFQEKCVEENTNTKSLVDKLLSDNKSDKVIVTTIQKLGLALDGNNKREYKKSLEPLQHKRIVFIFDECHRSQFGENHKAIKEFFPKAQLFGFTGTPIFDDNANYQKIEDEKASYKTTEDIFQKELHAYTITNAIDDRNVLKFHIDYYEGSGTDKHKAKQTIAEKQAIIEAILEKHEKATSVRKFNAIFATSSINDAIEYYELFQNIQQQKQQQDINFKPLNIACVFSPPNDISSDVKQMQEDLIQETKDNKEQPQEKKQALTKIINHYNIQYSTNHTINEFDLYYQDVQKRIKDQQYSNEDLPHSQKIDITIVVDMLLTGFDSKFLNTLYVDKNLKYHGLIQAFSRTNRVLNDTKPYGNIIDFRMQKKEVDEAIELFSGDNEKAKEIWLVEDAPKVINKLQLAIKKLDEFMQSKGLANKPEQVSNLKGDIARSTFINLFKEVQRLKTQLDQYTNLTENDKNIIEKTLPKNEFKSFKGVYLETAKQLKEVQDKKQNIQPQVEQLDFEFVLFTSNVIDYDYIMDLLADYSQNPDKQKMTPEELIEIIKSDAKFIDDFEDIKEYIQSLKNKTGLTIHQIKQGYIDFKQQKNSKEIFDIADKHNLDFDNLQNFVNNTIKRMIFDGEQLRDLLAPLQLGWKARSIKELELVKDLLPILHRLAGEREISGLKAYE